MTPEIEDGDADSLAADPLAAPAADSDVAVEAGGRGPGRGDEEGAADRPRRLVRRALLRGLREQGEDQPRGADPVPGRRGLHLSDRGAHRGGHRDQERQARAGQPQGPAGLPAGPHGAQRRVLGRRPQHPRCHRLRRRHLQALAADPRRGRQDPRPGDHARRPPAPPAARRRRRCRRRAGRRRRLRGRRVGHRHGRAVRHPARHHQRDQRRAAEAAGAGLDLRPRDARRAVVQPGQRRSDASGSHRATS